MWNFIIPWLLLAGLPLGLALLCGFIQKLLATHLDGELKALRPLLLGILPLACGLLSLYTLFKVITITGWDLLGWGLFLFWAGSALLGTLFGWGMGNDKRKKRQVLSATPTSIRKVNRIGETFYGIEYRKNPPPTAWPVSGGSK